jgi:hypothetical protein
MENSNEKEFDDKNVLIGISFKHDTDWMFIIK